MEEKKPQNIYQKYPALAIILPAAGGFFAWYFTQIVWLGLLIFFAGLMINWFNFHHK